MPKAGNTRANKLICCTRFIYSKSLLGLRPAFFNDSKMDSHHSPFLIFSRTTFISTYYNLLSLRPNYCDSSRHLISLVETGVEPEIIITEACFVAEVVEYFFMLRRGICVRKQIYRQSYWLSKHVKRKQLENCHQTNV